METVGGLYMKDSLQADNNMIDYFTERGTELNIEVIQNDHYRK